MSVELDNTNFHPGTPTGMDTPWGRSDGDWDEMLAEGIVRVSTPSHGGIGVFGPGLNRLSREARMFGQRMGEALWYEEDCLWAIVAFELPELFPKKRPEYVRECLERWSKEYLRLVDRP